MLLGDRAERQHIAAAGIGEQHVEAAGLFLDLRVHRIQLDQFRGIAADADGAVADGLHRGIEFRLPAPADEDLRAFVGQNLRRSEADACGAAGDQRHSVVKFVAHVRFSVRGRIGIDPAWADDRRCHYGNKYQFLYFIISICK